MDIKIKKPINYIFYSLAIGYGIAITLYVIFRAWKLGITHDEAYTYTRYMHRSFWDIFAYNSSDPNNHMLNTVIMKVLNGIFGMKTFLFRIPSIIAFIVFLVYYFRIFIRNFNGFFLLCGLILISINPYVLDFFSIARGYAASIACMTVSVFLAFKFIKGSYAERSVLNYAILFGGISVLFHLSSLNFFFPFSILIILMPLLQKLLQQLPFEAKITQVSERKNPRTLETKSYLNLIKHAVLIFALFLGYALRVVFHFKNTGEFDFAGNEGFWHDTVGSFIAASIYYIEYDYYLIIKQILTVLIIFVSIGSIFLVIIPAIRRKIWDFASFNALLVFAIAFFIILQHLILNNTYPIDRFVVFLFPLFISLSLFVFYKLYTFQRALIVLPIIVLFFFILHFAKSMNIRYVFNWKFDAETHQMLRDLNHIRKAENIKGTINLGGTWMNEPTINYYRKHDKLYWLRNYNRESFNKRQQYLYLFQSDLPKIKDWKYKILRTYPIFPSVLVENLEPDTSKAIYETIVHPNESGDLSVDIPYNNLSKTDSMLVEVRMTSNAKMYHVNEVVLLMRRKNDDIIYFKNEPTENYAIDKSKSENFYFNLIIPPMTDTTEHTQIFIDKNKSKKHLNPYSEMRVRVFLLNN